MSNNFNLAFSNTVKIIQSRKGSRAACAKKAAHDDVRTVLNDDLVAFIENKIVFTLVQLALMASPTYNTVEALRYS